MKGISLYPSLVKREANFPISPLLEKEKETFGTFTFDKEGWYPPVSSFDKREKKFPDIPLGKRGKE